MKTLEELYEEVEREKIEVLDMKKSLNLQFKKKKSMIVSYQDDNTILIDYSKVKDSKEEKIIIAEEKAHCETGAFYLLHSPYELIDRMEYKARKRAYNELIPYNTLKELSKHLTVDELSDYFGVPIKDIIMASFLYANIENFANKEIRT